MYVLEVQAEGMPRYVGPFSFRYQAEDWIKGRIKDGSWSVFPVMPPTEVTGAEWGTDYWGTIETEPSEQLARSLANLTGATVYQRTPGGDWEVADQ